jgi:hypothetical protein
VPEPGIRAEQREDRASADAAFQVTHHGRLQPGDLLIVDILDVGPIPQEDPGPLAGQGWGYTGVFATQNGGGFLTEWFPDAYKVIWGGHTQLVLDGVHPHSDLRYRYPALGGGPHTNQPRNGRTDRELLNSNPAWRG